MKFYRYIIFFLLFVSCNKQITNEANKTLSINKSKFDNLLINHFPNKLDFCSNHKIVSEENILKNNIGMLIYCYEVKQIYLDSISLYYQNESIAQYKNTDSCLLIINKFEDLNTYNNGEKVYMDYDTRKNQNKECFYTKFPIPKFLSYKNVDINSQTYLPDGFVYYVLEAKKGKIFNKYDLIPNPQMPTMWENGFSKGVAINKENKEIIFWGIIW